MDMNVRSTQGERLGQVVLIFMLFRIVSMRESLALTKTNSE